MRIPTAIAIAVLAAAAWCQNAAAHAVVKHAEPAAGATLASAPTQVALTFNEKVETAFSSVLVKNAAGKSMGLARAALNPANPAMLQLPLAPLAAGIYSVSWVAVGGDGHRRTGQYSFTVK